MGSIQSEFGKKLKNSRTNFFISQKELSHRSGIPRSDISKIESGKINVSLETINKLSLGLNMKPCELLDFCNDSKKIKPFVKWAGGKTQLLERIKQYIPKEFNSYFEPFVGGGALLFSLKPLRAYINDNNRDLMYTYECFMDEGKYNKFVKEIKKHEKKHSEKYFLEVREIDRTNKYLKMKEYQRAARFVYLNKACFNGLYRVNKNGFYNVPSGKKKQVMAFEKDNFENIKKYLSNNEIHVQNTDFEAAVKLAKKGDFVYFDPPYDSEIGKQTFTSYQKKDFDKNEQIRLKKVFENLSKRKVNCMLSNNNTKFIREIYKKYNIHIINAKRMINSNPDGRGEVEEVLITNY